jgi:hypothetical protein
MPNFIQRVDHEKLYLQDGSSFPWSEVRVVGKSMRFSYDSWRLTHFFRLSGPYYYGGVYGGTFFYVRTTDNSQYETPILAKNSGEFYPFAENFLRQALSYQHITFEKTQLNGSLLAMDARAELDHYVKIQTPEAKASREEIIRRKERVLMGTTVIIAIIFVLLWIVFRNGSQMDFIHLFLR